MNGVDTSRLIRHGRNQVVTTIGLTDAPFISSHSSRHSITFFSHATNRYTISFQGAAILDSGPTIYPGQPPFTMGYEDFG